MSEDKESLSESKLNTVKVFRGNKKDYPSWLRAFRAICDLRGCAEALEKNHDGKMPDKSTTAVGDDDAGNAQKLAIKQNKTAMAMLSCALQGDAMTNVLSKCETPNWPHGLACKVMETLEKRFNPDGIDKSVNLMNDLAAVRMAKKQDPNELIDELEGIQARYRMLGEDVPDKVLVARALVVAPELYNAALIGEKRSKGTNLDLDSVRDCMTDLYTVTYGAAATRAHGKSDSEDNKEVSLMQTQGGGFKGQCFLCKKRGHKASQCPNKKAKGNPPKQEETKESKKSVTCTFCGKQGHEEDKCWLKPGNKVPAHAVKLLQKQVQAANVGKSNDKEVQLCQVVEQVVPHLLELQLQHFPGTLALLNDPNVFVADSGSSSHSTGHSIGIEDLQVYKGGSFVQPSGAEAKPTSRGSLPVTLCDCNGNELRECRLMVNYVKGQKFNLISETKLQLDGWIPGGNKTSRWMTKGDVRIVFDIMIKTQEGCVFAAYFKRRNVANGTVLANVERLTMLQAHRRLGHCNEDTTRAAAKALGWTLVPGALDVCEACTMAKAKQKNVSKTSEHVPSDSANGRIHLDLAKIKSREGLPKPTRPNWLIMVDEKTQLKFTSFHETKNGMVEPTCVQLDQWRQNGKEVKHIRLDNAGENKLLKRQATSQAWKLNIGFEFTARDTPQHNHLAELAFASIANKGRAMMIDANVPLAIRYRLFREAFQTATLLDGLLPVTIDGVTKSRYAHWSGGEEPKYAKFLRTWGEAGTVKLKSLATGKLGDRGTPCMFVGYAVDHAGDVYRMWDPKTGFVHESRDITWLRRMYYTSTVIAGEDFVVEVPAPEVGEGGNDDIAEAGEGMDIENETEIADASADDKADDNPDDKANDNSDDKSDNGDDKTVAVVTTRSGRRVNLPARYREVAAGNMEVLFPSEKRFYDGLQKCYELSLFNVDQSEIYMPEQECQFVGMGIGGGFDNTQELHVLNYDQAMATGDCKQWSEAVEKEHERMQKHAVFEPVLISSLPKGTKAIDSTWAMKKKADGTYRARLAARGFKQVPDVHYDPDTRSSPVVCDASVRCIFVLAVMAKWPMHVIDVQGAFLHGEFENGEVIYMKVPKGFEKHYNPETEWLQLRRTLYGLIQAAIAFWRKLVLAFISIGFARCKADPCVFYKWVEQGIVIWVVVVDDCNGTGPEEALLESKRQFMEIFACDDQGEMKEYIGCKVDYNWKEGYMKILQPVLIQSFKDEFDVDMTEVLATPAVPGQVLRKGETDIVPIQQFKYRSGVGKLIHTTKWSRVECLNAVRELARHMGSSTSVHVQAMHRCMSYMLQTPNRGLVLRPGVHWNGDKSFVFKIMGRSDANYAACPDTRRSVTGYTVFVANAPTECKCNMQNWVVLSVTEAETVSATSCAQSMMFHYRLFCALGLTVELPMILEVDNKGAKDLVNNWSVGGRLRHVDIRQFFLRDLKEDGLIRVKWIPTEENSSDLFTKNLFGPTFEQHATTYVGIDEYMQYVDCNGTQGEGVGGIVPNNGTVPGKSTVCGGTVPGGTVPDKGTVPEGTVPGKGTVPGGTVPGSTGVPDKGTVCKEMGTVSGRNYSTNPNSTGGKREGIYSTKCTGDHSSTNNFGGANNFGGIK